MEKAKILVVEDEFLIAGNIRRRLEKMDYDVVGVVSNGEDAIGIFKERTPDLVLMDIMLEGEMDGIETARHIRSYDNKPVIFLTALGDKETLERAKITEPHGYLVKPFEYKDLLSTIEITLHKYETEKKLRERDEEKKEYLAKLEAIFGSVRDGIITVCRDFSIMELNQSAERICGLARKKSIGTLFSSIVTGCNKRCCEAIKETIDKGKPVEIYRLECRRKDHPGQVVTIHTSPVYYTIGIPSDIVMVIRDETYLNDLERDMELRRRHSNIIGKSKQMQAVYSLIETLTDIKSTVLITGESGTGKELVAEAIHYSGARSNQPLVKVNCSALSEYLLESELFGHMKGAFTGALRDKKGRFQRADGGTIFLDEIGDISPRIQKRLLRVLQDGEFERVGDSTPIRVDVRVVAATNKNLTKEVSKGDFREDLYYRLKVVELAIPPLRDRREDIPLLLNHFVQRFNQKLNRNIRGVSDDVNKKFMTHSWPGNVRELEHSLEHASILCRHSVIKLEHLPASLTDTPKENVESVKGKRNEVELQAVIDALEKTRWNKTMAAKLLGIDRQTIYRKIKKYNIT